MRSDLFGIFTLRALRSYLTEIHAGRWVVLVAATYSLASMIVGGMLLFTPLTGGYTSEIVLASPNGQQPWDFPEFLLFAPWGIVTLPLLATLTMGVVSVGIGAGLVAAVGSTRRLRRPARTSSFAAFPGLVGFTPAALALVTLGACCSTTAVATAGVGLVADLGGTTPGALLFANWYLDVFQLGMVAAALLAQELLLRVVLASSSAEPAPGRPPDDAPEATPSSGPV